MDLLALFYYPTLDFSAEMRSLSMAVPMLDNLMSEIIEKQETDAYLPFFDAMEDANLKLKKYQQDHGNPAFYISTLLDCRWGLDIYRELK